MLEALRLYQSIKFVGLHHTYSLLVAINRSMGNYEDALKYGLAVLESSRAARDTTHMTYSYLQLGWICEQLNQPEDAIKYHKIALVKATEQREAGSVFYVVKYICQNLLRLNRPAEAYSFFLEILRKYPPTERDDKGEIAYILSKYYL
jgi:tetratricopeptide (TPR) repeat protein